MEEKDLEEDMQTQWLKRVRLEKCPFHDSIMFSGSFALMLLKECNCGREKVRFIMFNGGSSELLGAALREVKDVNQLVDGTTFLHAAVRMQYPTYVKTLIYHGADPWVVDAEGHNARAWASPFSRHSCKATYKLLSETCSSIVFRKIIAAALMERKGKPFTDFLCFGLWDARVVFRISMFFMSD